MDGQVPGVYPESQSKANGHSAIRHLVDYARDWAMGDPEPIPHVGIGLQYLRNPNQSQ